MLVCYCLYARCKKKPTCFLGKQQSTTCGGPRKFISMDVQCLYKKMYMSDELALWNLNFVVAFLAVALREFYDLFSDSGFWIASSGIS